jgi:hypothetical protein
VKIGNVTMFHQDHPENAPPAAAMRQMIMGFRTTQLIYVAAKLGIADVLKDGPQDAAAIASAVDAHQRPMGQTDSAGQRTQTDSR